MSRFVLGMHDPTFAGVHRRHPRVELRVKKHPDPAPRRLLCQIAQCIILWETENAGALSSQRSSLYSSNQENSMPQSPHARAAELHNLAAHAHAAAAAAHGKGDYLTAHELSKQAHEHSMNAIKHAKEINTVATGSNKP